MKKFVLTIAIVLGLSIGAFAQGGLFGKGETSGSSRDEGSSLIGKEGPGMPGGHGNGGDSPAPLGSGALLLIGFGAAYALKKRQED